MDRTAVSSTESRRLGSRGKLHGIGTLLSLLALPGLALATALLPAGCERDEPRATSSPRRTVQMKLGNQTFTLEVANTPYSREYGLMNRTAENLPPDRGMIFVFGEEEERGFWNHDVPIGLDLIAIDAQGKVVSIKELKPMDETRVRTDGAAKWVIELNRGAAEKAGLKVGDVLTIPPKAQKPADGR